ncbi:methyltransferase [Streptomyces buecherae]|uniref:methyltransferase n=1 Tax=Streptomyces buecherae TaxID=2763006 RepID=UPI001C25A0A4|nr:class I SAM-dependent methyltransferase [Streptomyces buecherae]
MHTPDPRRTTAAAAGTTADGDTGPAPSAVSAPPHGATAGDAHAAGSPATGADDAAHPRVGWTEGEVPHTARWRSESGAPAPRRVVVGDDRMTADAAYKLVCEGTAVLWRGDYHNARQLLQAMARRADRKRPARKRRRGATGPATPVAGDQGVPDESPARAFHLHRKAQAQRARLLGMLLVPLEPGPDADAGPRVPLRRAPDVGAACREAWGAGDAAEPAVISLRELLGLIGAHEWRHKGVPIPALGGERVHAYYGVFSPVRGEYVDLVAEAPLPAGAREVAFDIGTGTGVLAALLARRGVRRVVATDQDPRALACARENAARLGVAERVEVRAADLFPPGRAPLVVCNPPWVPARPSSPVEYAVYDPDSRMLRGFLGGLAAHLAPGGEGWLILSDLAEHLGLRTRAELLHLIDAAGLRVLDRLDTRPRHARATDPTDPLHAARAAEVTSLWRLTAISGAPPSDTA